MCLIYDPGSELVEFAFVVDVVDAVEEVEAPDEL